MPLGRRSSRLASLSSLEQTSVKAEMEASSSTIRDTTFLTVLTLTFVTKILAAQGFDFSGGGNFSSSEQKDSLRCFKCLKQKIALSVLAHLKRGTR